MEIRVLIAGSRTYTDYREAAAFIEQSLGRFPKTATFVLISGTCRGADRLGERFATEHGWGIERYPADWQSYGRAAGPLRNKAMMDVCDFVICFWDGKSKGTQSLMRLAAAKNKLTALKRIDTEDV